MSTIVINNGKKSDIVNCPLTKCDTNIVREYDITNTRDIHTGIDVEAQQVHVVFAGVIIQVNRGEDNLYSIIEQYDSYTYVRYSHLKDVCLRMGQVVTTGELLGTASDFVHFEYLTRIEPTDADFKFPVRIGSITCYKIDPTDIATGSVTLVGGD